MLGIVICITRKTVMKESTKNEGQRRKTSHQEDPTIENTRPEMKRQKTNILLAEGVDTEEMTCPICLAEFQEGDDICWSHNPSCDHTFHMDCIEQWLVKHDGCPLCRLDYLVPATKTTPPKRCQHHSPTAPENHINESTSVPRVGLLQIFGHATARLRRRESNEENTDQEVPPAGSASEDEESVQESSLHPAPQQEGDDGAIPMCHPIEIVSSQIDCCRDDNDIEMGTTSCNSSIDVEC